MNELLDDYYLSYGFKRIPVLLNLQCFSIQLLTNLEIMNYSQANIPVLHQDFYNNVNAELLNHLPLFAVVIEIYFCVYHDRHLGFDRCN